MLDAAVVGAGPYGLSIASHLRARGVEHRIFGTPMHTWRTQMPQGMFLKSEGFASNLFDPAGAFTLGRYCAEHGLPYADSGLPVRREAFANYGMAFQQSCVPELEQLDVAAIEPAAHGFRLTLENGETLSARRVVLAVGITHFAYMPKELIALPPELVSHSSRHADLRVFAGREVVVLGAGASAMDCAALLVQAGAAVRLVARASTVLFHGVPSDQRRSLLQRLRAWPPSGLGQGWRLWLCANAPMLFHLMPEHLRIEIVRRSLPPAPGWWTRAMVEGKVDFHLGQTILGAAERGGRIELALGSSDGTRCTLVADHLIAGTGYHPDIRRLDFLSPILRAQLRTAGDAPVLSHNFESSVAGLYFVGLAAANAFGPALRFALGAGFTSRTLARHFGDRWRPARDRASRP